MELNSSGLSIYIKIIPIGRPTNQPAWSVSLIKAGLSTRGCNGKVLPRKVRLGKVLPRWVLSHENVVSSAMIVREAAWIIVTTRRATLAYLSISWLNCHSTCLCFDFSPLCVFKCDVMSCYSCYYLNSIATTHVYNVLVKVDCHHRQCHSPPAFSGVHSPAWLFKSGGDPVWLSPQTVPQPQPHPTCVTTDSGVLISYERKRRKIILNLKGSSTKKFSIA